MVDMARVDPDIETPVNPYSLLEAVNSSSDTSHTGWLLFLAVMTYLVIAVAGVTHEALLLETPVQLPILQVKIQLKQFFQFAPIVLVLFHLGILAQLVLLARKTLEFEPAVVVEALALFAREGAAAARAQDARGVARLPDRIPEHSRLDPTLPLRELYDKIRAADPEGYPAYFEVAGQKVCIKLWRPDKPADESDLV